MWNIQRLQLPSFAGGCLLVVCASPTFGGDPRAFTARFDIASGGLVNAPTSVFAADLDGDGDLDVLTTASGNVLWHENDGGDPPLFITRVIDTVLFSGVRSVRAADLDGDNDLDVFWVDANNDTIRWGENVGGNPPAFIVRDVFSQAVLAFDVTAVDLDGDGDLDLISASAGDDTIRWHKNEGGSPLSFTTLTIASGSGLGNTIGAADLNGDGAFDIFAGASNALLWFENDGAPNPSFSMRTLAAGIDTPTEIVAGDLDGDLDIDLVSASNIFNADDTLRWHENTGGAPPAFTTRDIEVDQSAFTGARIGDVDNDGDQDIVVASAADLVQWYENTGGVPIVFVRHVISTGAKVASDVHIADVDGDNALDIISASSDDDAIRWYRNDSAVWPRVVFEDRLITNQALGAVGVSAADLDQDGDIDVLSASPLDSLIRWYDNDGADPPALLARIVGGTIFAGTVIAADLDSDGDVDVVSSAGGGGVDSFLSSGAAPPFFTPAPVFNPPESGLRVTVGDFDGDGDLDLASGWQAAVSSFLWHRNEGGSPPVYTVMNIPVPEATTSAMVATDIDSDGDVDLLAIHLAGGSNAIIRLHLNDGANPPQFQPIVIADITGAGMPQAICVADLDGDLDLDIAVGGLSETLRWFENDGANPPSFIQHDLSSAYTASPASTFAIVALDIDRDGDIDLATAMNQGDPIRWHENIGGNPLRFITHIVSMAPDSARSVFIADVNGDGQPDLLSASANDNSIRWHENLFHLPGDFNDDGLVNAADLASLLAGWGPDQGFGADLTGDGVVNAADLATLLANWTTSTP